MKLIHIGGKNYPPAHGGVEKIIYDIGDHDGKYDVNVLVEWPQEATENVQTLPRKIYDHFFFIKKNVKKKEDTILHFHKETFSLHAILFSILNYNTVLTIHGCAWRIKRWGGVLRSLLYILDLLSCIFVKKIVFVSKNDVDHFSKIIFWRNLIYIPNGVAEQECVCSCDLYKCVYIGRISPEKNILGLVRSFANSDLKLSIYGPYDKHSDSYRQAVDHEINKLENVEYKGTLAYDEVIPTLLQYNTFCNFSFSEGMPVSVLEASSIGMNLMLSSIKPHLVLQFPDVIYVETENPKLEENFVKTTFLNKSHQKSYYSITNMQQLYYRLYEKIIS